MTTNAANSSYTPYEKDNHKKWECKEKIGSPTSSYADAVAACDVDPLCKYIQNEDCAGTEGFELCISLEKHHKSCALEKTEKGNNK